MSVGEPKIDKDKVTAYVVDFDSHIDGVGNGIGYLVRKIHLFTNRIHGSIHLVDIAVIMAKASQLAELRAKDTWPN